VSIQKWLFCPIFRRRQKLWRDKLRHARVLILEILQGIPAVKPFAFLDLEQNFSFLDGHYLEKAAHATRY
jgi:hypothetical protein